MRAGDTGVPGKADALWREHEVIAGHKRCPDLVGLGAAGKSALNWFSPTFRATRSLTVMPVFCIISIFGWIVR